MVYSPFIFCVLLKCPLSWKTTSSYPRQSIGNNQTPGPTHSQYTINKIYIQVEINVGVNETSECYYRLVLL